MPNDAHLPDDGPLAVAGQVQTARRGRQLQLAVTLLGIAALATSGLAFAAALRSSASLRISCQCGVPGPVTASELSRAHWSALPRSPLGPRSDPIVAWTDPFLIELGGTRNGVIQRDGAVFDASVQRWRRIAAVPGSIGLNGAVSVSTSPVSRQLFVASDKVAGLYDPVTNRWTTTKLPRQLAGLHLIAPVWTGYDVILAGTSGSAARPRLAVAAYQVADRRWQTITPRLPARHPARAVSMVATWHRVILWSMWSRRARTPDGHILSGVDVRVLHDHMRQWTPMRHWPQHRVVDGAVFAQFQILIPPGQYWYGGPGSSGESPARFADAGSLALTAIPGSPLVTGPVTQPAIWLWNGNTVLAANVSGYSEAAPNGRLGSLAAYDFYSGRWHVLRRVPGGPALATAPFFARQQLLVLTLDGRLLFLGQRL